MRRSDIDVLGENIDISLFDFLILLQWKTGTKFIFCNQSLKSNISYIIKY